MSYRTVLSGVLFTIMLLLVGCGGGEEETVAVESGTYEGTISEVVPEEREIYVDVPNTGTLELYFTDSTEVMQGGQPASFDQLSTDQPVSVTVEKIGQRLNPIAVEILE